MHIFGGPIRGRSAWRLLFFHAVALILCACQQATGDAPRRPLSAKNTIVGGQSVQIGNGGNGEAGIVRRPMLVTSPEDLSTDGLAAPAEEGPARESLVDEHE